MLSQKYLGFASVRKYDFTDFRKHLQHKFASMVSQFFAVFRKLSQFMGFASLSKLWQAFTSFRKWTLERPKVAQK